MVKASPSEREALWRDRILRLRLFQLVRDALVRQEKHQLDRDFVLELIAVYMPSEDYEGMFETFVNWSRFGNLFSYDEETETLALQHEA